MNDLALHLTISGSRDGLPLHVSDEIKLPGVINAGLIGATVVRMCALLEAALQKGDHIALAQKDADRTAEQIQKLNPHGFQSVEDALTHHSPQLAAAVRGLGIDPDDPKVCIVISYAFLLGAQSAMQLATLAWNTDDSELMQTLVAEQAEITQRFRDAERQAAATRTPETLKAMFTNTDSTTGILNKIAADRFFAVAKDAESYNTAQCQGAEIPETALAFLYGKPEDAPEGELQRLKEFADDDLNWFHDPGDKCALLSYDLGAESFGSIKFYRITHL